MLLNPDVIKETANEVLNNLKAGRYRKAVAVGRNLSSAKIAATLISLNPEISAQFLKVIDKKRAGRVIASMRPEFSVEVLMGMAEDERIALINSVPADNIDDIFEQMAEEDRSRIILKLDKKLKMHAEKAKKYPRGSTGRLLSPYFFAVEPERTVAETLDSILSAPAEIDRLPYVYVLDDKNAPIGVVSVKDLFRIDKTRKVKEVLNQNIVVVRVADPAIEAAKIIQNRRLTMLPVLGEDGSMEGVLTFDDAMRILSENTLDFMTFSAGVQEESFFTPPIKSIKCRLPWMAINVFLNMGAVAVITRFEATIATVAILAAFIPMITDMGGNIGIQSLSVAIRSIALGEAKLRDFKKLVKKEAMVGLANGMFLGALFGFIAFALKGNPYLGLLAGIALGINVLVAGIVGGALPFLIKAFGKDPAMMTGPFLTTITDITGVSIYLGLSTLFITLLS